MTEIKETPVKRTFADRFKETLRHSNRVWISEYEPVSQAKANAFRQLVEKAAINKEISDKYTEDYLKKLEEKLRTKWEAENLNEQARNFIQFELKTLGSIAIFAGSALLYAATSGTASPFVYGIGLTAGIAANIDARLALVGDYQARKISADLNAKYERLTIDNNSRLNEINILENLENYILTNTPDLSQIYSVRNWFQTRIADPIKSLWSKFTK